MKPYSPVKLKPDFIAWSKGLVVIPFENILAVAEDPKVDGQLLVALNSHVEKTSGIIIHHDDVEEFLNKYNRYLAAVEGLTIESKFVDSSEEVRP